MCYYVLKGVRMSQLRQEDSETIVSTLRRHCIDSGSMSMTSDVPDEDVHNLPLASFELTGQLSKLSKTMTEFPEKDSEAVIPRCPVCGRSLQWVGGNEMLLNKHVDECLNRVAVSELLASEKQTPTVSK